MTLLARYETAAGLTRNMLEAARRQDWDALTAAGAERDALFAALPTTLPPLPADEGRALARLIDGMLAAHAEIADRAGPWLEHVATLLAAFAQATPPGSVTDHPAGASGPR